MTAPICSVHGTDMRAGNKGGWFCPRKLDDGTYCTQRVSGKPATATAAQTPTATTEPRSEGASPRLLLLLGCLDWSSRIFQGTGQSEDARACASELYATLKDKL